MFFKKRNTNHNFDFTSVEGFERVYNMCFDKMFEIGFYQTNDEDKTREIIQEFFTLVWEKREEYGQKEKVEFYLIRIFKYRIIDFLRSEATRQKHEDGAAKEYCELRNCVEEEVLYHELSNNVNQLIDQLSCQCKKVFLMSHEKGMSNKEIASSLLISERAVAYHLAKARSTLKENLPSHQSLL
ncbi:MAG: sigma-70 family RNA polymerase sigma factor [Bacteroidota bacterium]